MKFKTIGILGGMGPEASANFYNRIIKYCQEKYDAVQDTDYPKMIINSLPLEGFDETGIVNETKVLNQLVAGIKTLENAGCQFAAIPCNTVHHFIKVLRKEAKIPILSIIEETSEKIKQNRFTKIGLLASETTLNLKIYQEVLNKDKIKTITPKKKDHEKTTKLILEVMGGKVAKKTKDAVVEIMKEMKRKDAEAIVLGCTEIPLAISQKDTTLKVYDTLQILAESAVDYSISQTR